MRNHEDNVEARRSALGRILEAELLGGSLLVAVAYFKLSYLKTLGAPTITRFLARDGLDFATLSPLFARDVWLCLAILPAAFLAIAWRSRPVARWGAALGILVVVATCAIADVAQEISGALPTAGLLLQATQAWLSDADIMSPGEVLQPAKLERLGLLAALLVGSWLAPLSSRRVATIWKGAALAVVAAALAVSAVHLFGPEQRLRIARPFVALVWEALVRPDERTTSDPRAIAARAPSAVFAEAFFPRGAPVAPAETPALLASVAPPLPGIPGHAPPNVVWVILETASYDDYPLDRLTAEMPRLTSLLPHAAVATRHLASSRLSIREDFALQTGLLDCCGGDWMARELRARGAGPPDSLARILRARGYATHYLYPAPFTFEIEAWMAEYLGFEHVELTGSATARGPGSRRLDGERAMFGAATRAIATECAAGRPFFVVARSLIGHYPLLDVDTQQPARGDRTTALRGIAREIDDQLGRIVDTLAGCGQLDDTILVIVGDHGPRTKAEDPGLDLRFLDERSFHVPMLLIHPGRFAEQRRIEQLTSHVDVVPTVLALMGIPHAAFLHEGRSIFDPALARRAVPFAAGEFSPQRGVAFEDDAFSYDRENDVASVGPVFRTAKRALLGGDDPRRAAFLRMLAKFDDARMATLIALSRRSRDGAAQDAAAAAAATAASLVRSR